ncbi:MAG: amidohydrolase family protein, partial [Candidatus Omnitrophota bacterium]
FDLAPFGIVGLETALPLTLKLVEEKVLTMSQLVECMSLNPARVIMVDRGHLSVGSVADVTVFDPQLEWIVEREQLQSKSKNTPFLGSRLKGRATDVLCQGRVVMQGGKIVGR